MAKKETRPEVSSIAGKWLSLLRGVRGSRDVGHYARGAFGGMIGWLGTVSELRSVLGSALGQDETKGQAKAKPARDLDREATLILRSLFSSASFNGSAQRAAAAWLRRDGKRRAAERAELKPNGRKKRKGARR